MTEPRVGLWHPDFADDPDLDKRDVGLFVSWMGPFMATYHGLTVDDYWSLSVTEHAAMLEWLYKSEVLVRPEASDGK